MSDYEATFTYQTPDYAANRRAWQRQREKLEGKPVWERIHTRMPKSKYITSTVPNPLSMELRIVLGYFWEIYRDDLMLVEHNPTNVEALQEAKDCLTHVYNLCHFLFSPASPYSHIHVHSECGCKDDSCPTWAAGYECAKENVLDWHTPD